jgi:hypothetical protein
VIRTFRGPDLVTMQRIAPHRGIRRMMTDVKTQCCEHLFLIGNRESVIERPIAKSANNCVLSANLPGAGRLSSGVHNNGEPSFCVIRVRGEGQITGPHGSRTWGTVGSAADSAAGKGHQ